MKKLFIGYVLAAFSFTINLANGCALVLPPPFVGVLVMVLGCKELKDHDNRFGAAAVVGSLVAAALFAEWLIMLNGWVTGYRTYINAITPVLRLIFDFLWIWGIGDMEKSYGTYLYGAALRVLWILQFVETALMWLGLLSPLLILFTIVAILAAMVLSVVFIVFLYRSWKAYDHLQLVRSLRQ